MHPDNENISMFQNNRQGWLGLSIVAAMVMLASLLPIKGRLWLNLTENSSSHGGQSSDLDSGEEADRSSETRTQESSCQGINLDSFPDPVKDTTGCPAAGASSLETFLGSEFSYQNTWVVEVFFQRSPFIFVKDTIATAWRWWGNQGTFGIKFFCSIIVVVIVMD